MSEVAQDYEFSVFENNLGLEEAERALLCSFTLDSSLLDEFIAMGYGEEVFYLNSHELMARAMVAIKTRGDALNVTTLVDELSSEDPTLENVGGMPRVGEVFSFAGTSAHYQSYLRIVLDGYTQRRFRETAAKLYKAARNTRFLDVRQVVEGCVAELGELCNTEHGGKPSDMFAEAEAFLDSIECDETPRMSRPIFTGIPSVDRNLHPLDVATGDFYAILFAATSTGKSSLAAKMIAEQISRGYRVVCFLGETVKRKLALQMASQRAKVQTTMRGYRGEPDDRRRLARAELQRLRGEAEGLLFVYDSNFTIENVVSRSRNIAAKNGPIDLIVVDHMHQLKASGNFRNKKEKIDYISSFFKPLGLELGCTCLALGQPNREMQKEQRFPSLNDLGESGSLENDADRVWALYMPKEDSDKIEQDRMTAEPEVWLCQLKYREGHTGYEKLRFEKMYTLFKENEAEEPVEY